MNNNHISFIQHNCGRSSEIQQTVLQQAFESKTTVILLQEPYFLKLTEGDSVKYIALQHPAYFLVLPNAQGHLTSTRPRVASYIRKDTLEFSPEAFDDPDFQVIKAFGAEPFLIVNVYNERRGGIFTEQRLPALRHFPAFIAGDFNRHHPW